MGNKSSLPSVCDDNFSTAVVSNADDVESDYELAKKLAATEGCDQFTPAEDYALAQTLATSEGWSSQSQESPPLEDYELAVALSASSHLHTTSQEYSAEDYALAQALSVTRSLSQGNPSQLNPNKSFLDVPPTHFEALVAGKPSEDYALAKILATNEGCSQVTPAQKSLHKPPFLCQICLEDNLPAFKGYQMECRHQFCLHCLEQLVRTSITARSSRIVCPYDKCPQLFSLKDIRSILQASPTVFREYTELANVSLLESEAADGKCDTRRCPADHCNYLFVYVPGTGFEGRKFDCPQCTASFCLQCGANDGKVGPGHPGLMCAERLELLEQEAEERRKLEAWRTENSQADRRFDELIKEERQKGLSKPCPKCNVVITKNGGCSHMHCTRCGTDFDWSLRSTS